MRDRDEIRRALEEVAEAHGGTVQQFPVHQDSVRSVVLRDVRSDDVVQYEAASIKTDGSLVVEGWDSGAKVSAFFGEGITSYDWTYVVAADRVPLLVEQLGGVPGSDVLELLKGYYDEHRGVLSPLLRSDTINADFHNWHS